MMNLGRHRPIDGRFRRGSADFLKRCGGGGMSACTNANLTANNAFVYLRYLNQDARLHGFDLSGFTDLGKHGQWGQFTLIGVLSGRSSGGGAALIAVDGKPAKPFRVGAAVDEGLVLQALAEARALGYLRCYLETTADLREATSLYESLGFEHLPGPLGCTGHDACEICMVLAL